MTVTQRLLRESTTCIGYRCPKNTRSWLRGVVVSALGIRARGPGFESRVAPLFLGQVVYTHTAFPVSQLQETGVQKGVFGA